MTGPAITVPVAVLRDALAAARSAVAGGAARFRPTVDRLAGIIDEFERPGLFSDPVAPVDAPRLPPMPKAPTSERMRRKAAPAAGTIRARIVDEVVSAAHKGLHGLTDHELEDRLGRTHQSVSAARNGLVADGWLTPATRDDGTPILRDNSFGNACQVWAPTPAAFAQAGDSPVDGDR